MRYLITGILALVFGLASPLMADQEAAQEIGTVKTLEGSAHVLRAAAQIPAVPGLALFMADTLVTEKGSALGVIFRDNSILSLGPDSRLSLTAYAYDPAMSRLGFAADMMRGTMTYLTGIIGRLNPASVKFQTPSALIGIRGTHLAIKVEE